MKSNRFWFILASIVSVLTLAACSSPASTATSSSNFGNNTTGQNPDGTNGFPGFDMNNLSPANKLIMGTLKLETTENKVTPEQAALLLPLWQAYLSLTTSNSAAQVEIDAVIKQIGESLTSDQNQAIEGMTFTADDFQTIFQELGMDNFRQSGLPGTPSPDQNGQTQSGGGFPDRPPEGGFIVPAPGGGEGGNFGGGGGGFGGGGGGFQGEPGTLTPEQQATRQARFGSAGSGVNQGFLRALVQFLETRSKETQ